VPRSVLRMSMDRANCPTIPAQQAPMIMTPLSPPELSSHTSRAVSCGYDPPLVTRTIQLYQHSRSLVMTPLLPPELSSHASTAGFCGYDAPLATRTFQPYQHSTDTFGSCFLDPSVIWAPTVRTLSETSNDHALCCMLNLGNT
jgi:hypothetical protein